MSTPTRPGGGNVFAGKRVVFVLPWAELAGAERQALYLAEHLVSLSASVEVCCFTDHDGPAIAAFRGAGVAWRVARTDWGGTRTTKVRELVSLARSLRSMRPDALLPYCTPANVLCGLTWRWTEATTCLWHQQDVLSSRFGDRLVRAALLRTPIVISNANHALGWLRDHGAPAARTVVIPPYARYRAAVDSRDSWRTRLEIEDDVPVACMLASLGPNKDHATLLRAWRHVLDRAAASGTREPVLVLAGRSTRNGEQLAKALAYDLELGRSARFLGFVEDVGGLLEASDLAVLSSRSEGLATAILEPMSRGMPVVATDIPGLHEAVGDGIGLFAPAGDHVALSEVIVRGLEDQELRAEARRRNPVSVEERFGRWTIDLHTRTLAKAMGLLEPLEAAAGDVTSTS